MCPRRRPHNLRQVLNVISTTDHDTCNISLQQSAYSTAIQHNLGTRPKWRGRKCSVLVLQVLLGRSPKTRRHLVVVVHHQSLPLAQHHWVFLDE